MKRNMQHAAEKALSATLAPTGFWIVHKTLDAELRHAVPLQVESANPHAHIAPGRRR